MKRGWQIFLHVIFWALIMSFLLFVAHGDVKFSNTDIVIIFVVYPIISVTLFYLNYLYLIPAYLNKKRYGLYALAIVITIVGYALIKYGVALFFKDNILHRVKGHEIGFWTYFISAVFTNILFLFLSAVLKFTSDWFLNERIQRDLENQRLSAELAFLKSQINPHFLFNSLNSIYSLAYQRSETTPEAILKLSEIMRYMLYECNDNRVDLAKELQYLHNYIDLQKIRFGEKAFINFKVGGVIESQQIVPLILIAFIENAFKHGIANDPLTPINITIDINASNLQFYIQNKKHNNNRDLSGGIGLSNVRRRLNLLYPDKFILNIIDEPQTYTCELSLKL